MKKRVQKTTSFSFLLGTLVLLSACERTHFKDISIKEPAALAEPGPDIPQDPVNPPTPPVIAPPPPPPIDPPPLKPPPPVDPPPIKPPPPIDPPPIKPPPPPPPPVDPPPVLKAGNCAPDSSTTLLSCMKCVVPMTPPPPLQFSEKGKSLIEIMAIGCSVPNKSAPKDYVPPTKAQLLARMSRLSPTLYPDSAMSAGQLALVSGLKTDVNLQKKVFGSVWYQPPYSDYFETYFGLTIGEAANYICYQSPHAPFTPYNTLEVHSKEYLDCTYDSFNCKEKTDYVNANIYRNHLRAGLRESISNPYVEPPPTPAKKCKWESFEGLYEQGAEEVLARWLTTGFKVGLENDALGGKCEMLTQLPSGANKPRGQVKIAGYQCK